MCTKRGIDITQMNSVRRELIISWPKAIKLNYLNPENQEYYKGRRGYFIIKTKMYLVIFFITINLNSTYVWDFSVNFYRIIHF